MQVQVTRSGAKKTLTVKLGQRPDTTASDQLQQQEQQQQQAPDAPNFGGGWYVVAGIISVIAGFVVLVWPFDSIVVLAVVTGVWLVVIGVVQIVQTFQIRKDAKTVREAVDSVSDRLTPRRKSA